MSQVTLTLVPWGPGTQVGAYPRKSEQIRPEGPPTGVAVAQTQPVAADASLTFTDLYDGEYFAAAPVNGAGSSWQYISFNVERPDIDAVAALQSPDGMWHAVTVEDDGRLVTEEIGTGPVFGPSPPYATAGDLNELDERLDEVEGNFDPLELNLINHGLLANGSMDAALASAKAAYAASGSSNGAVYVLPSGDYTSAAQIALGDREILRSCGGGLFGANYKSQTTITSSVNGQAVLVTGTAGWGIEGITFKGDRNLANQDLLTFGVDVAMGTGHVRDVSVSQAGRDGIVLDFCLNTHFDLVRVDKCKRHNWHFKDSENNANTFTKILSREADQWGIYYEGGVGNTFTTPTIESNARAGAALTGVTAAATDVFTKTSHGFAAGDAVQFSALTGGSGITAGTVYYVIPSGLTANEFKVATAVGGTALDVTADLTDGTVTKVVGGLRVSGVYHTTMSLLDPHFENNGLAVGIGVPVLVDRKPSTTYQVIVDTVEDSYSETNALILDGGRFTSLGGVSQLNPHAIIGANHEGAVWINPRRWGGGSTADGDAAFVLTDNSGESIVIGDGNPSGKPGILLGSDTEIYRDAAGTLRIADGDRLKIEGATSATILDIRRSGEAQARLIANTDGALTWGPGSTGGDTVLQRNSAGNGIALSNDDSFTLGSGAGTGGSFIQSFEQSADPAAPAANGFKVFAKDNGSGKTQLCVRFNTGATVVVATEP